MTRAVEKEDLTAIDRRAASTEVFGYVLGEARDRLEEKFGTPWDVWYAKRWPWAATPAWPDGGLVWDRSLDRDRFGAQTLFGWALDRFEVAGGQRVFAAGIWLSGSSPRRNPFVEERWVRARRRARFVLDRSSWGHPILVRTMAPTALLDRSLEQQVRKVVNFVADTHKALARSPPFPN